MENNSTQETPQIHSYFDEEGESPSAKGIGLHAGMIWQHIHSNGTTSIIQLKADLSCTATVLHLALGWLLREDKIELLREKGQLLVRLKD